MTTKKATQFWKITNLMRKTFLLVIWIEILWMPEVSLSVITGSGTLSVKLIEYENEKGVRKNWQPCDKSLFKEDCSHAFKIKINVFSGCAGDVVCSKTTTSMVYRGNTVNFGHYLDNDNMKPNPILVPFIKWTGGYRVEVWVSHKKSSIGDSDSLVDRFESSDYDLKLTTGHAVNVTLEGLTIQTRLVVQFNVSCDPGLYGPSCRCKPTSLLHVCTAEGKLTCKPGYVESGEHCVPMTTTLETTTEAANTPTQPCTATSTEAEQTTATDTQNLQIGSSTELPQSIKTTNVELNSTAQPEISAVAETSTSLMVSNETGSTTTSPASRDKVTAIFTTSELKPTEMVLDYTTSKTIDEKSTSELKASKTTAPEHISNPTETTPTVLQESTTRSHMGNEVIFTSAKTSDPSKTETSTITLLPTMSLKISTKFVEQTTLSQDLDTVPQRPMQTSYLPFSKPLPALTTSSSSKIATTAPNGRPTTFALPVLTKANLTKLKSTTEISPDTTEKTTKDTKTISNMNINSTKLSFTTARTTIRNTTARIIETKSFRTNQTEHMSGSTESTTAAVREPTTRLTLGVEDNYSIAQTSDPSTTVTSSTVMSASVTLEASEKSMKPTTPSEELVTMPVISTRARHFPSSTQLRLATTAWPKLSTKAPQKPLHTAAVSTAKQAFTSYYRPTTDRMNSRLSTYLRTISPKSLQSTTTNIKAHTTRGKNKKYSSSTMNTKAQEVTAVYNTAPTTQTTQLKTNEPTKIEQPHSPDSTVDLHFKVTKRNPLSATTKKEQGRNSMKPAEVTMSTTVQVKGATDGHEGKSPVIAFLSRFRTPLASVGFLVVFAVVIVIVAVKWNCSKRGKKCDSKVEHHSESTYSSESLRSDQRPTIGPNVVAHIDRNCLLWQDMSKTNNLGPIELPRIKLNTLRDYSKEKRNGRHCRYKDSTI